MFGGLRTDLPLWLVGVTISFAGGALFSYVKLRGHQLAPPPGKAA